MCVHTMKWTSELTSAKKSSPPFLSWTRFPVPPCGSADLFGGENWWEGGREEMNGSAPVKVEGGYVGGRDVLMSVLLYLDHNRRET